MNNYQGVILGKTPRDYVLGNQISLDINCENWENHLIDPQWKIEHEQQNELGFETYACVLFSGNDVKEMIMMNALKNKLISPKNVRWLTDNGYFKNGYINFDDRIPAMFAEIQEGLGTYQYKGANALRDWSLPQGFLKDKPKNFTEYTDKEKVNLEAIDLKLEFDKRFIWHWFWFRDDQDIDEQLKMSPSMSIVRFANGDGCLSPLGQFNHAVMEYGKQGECRKIDDSYNQQLKLYKPDFITSRLGFRLTILNNEIMDVAKFLKDNDLKVIWNRDDGGYAFIQQQMAKVIQSKDRDVLALYEMKFRADGKVSVSREEWNELPKGIF